MVRRTLAILAALVWLAACARYGGVAHVKAGSTASDLVLQFAADDTGTPLPPVDAIMISGGPVNGSHRGNPPATFAWFIAAIDTTPLASRVLREVRYGTVPPGFAEAARPLPLVAGRYREEIRAGHLRLRTWFVVDSDLTAHN